MQLWNIQKLKYYKERQVLKVKLHSRLFFMFAIEDHRIINCINPKWEKSVSPISCCFIVQLFLGRWKEFKTKTKFFSLSWPLFKPQSLYSCIFVYLCTKISNKEEVVFWQFPGQPSPAQEKMSTDWVASENKSFAHVYTFISLLKSRRGNKNYYHLEINLSQ